MVAEDVLCQKLEEPKLIMVAEDVLCQKLEEPKLSQRGPIKAVKINRKNRLDGSLGSPTADPHRKRKFNGDQKRADGKEESSRKETSSPPRSQNGCMAVDAAESSEKVIQENVVSCASEHYVDPGPDCGGAVQMRGSIDEDTLPVTSSVFDENSNLLQEGSESKPCGGEEGQNDPAEEQAFLSFRISAEDHEVPPDGLTVTDDLPIQSSDGGNDHMVLSEDPVDRTEEPQDSEIPKDNKDLKENSLEEAAHSSRNGDQRSRADKKPKEHNEEVKKKDRHEGKDKRDSEKDKSQEKTRVENKDQEQKTAGSVKKASDAKEHKDRSKSKEDRRKDGSKEERDKDGSKPKEDRHKDGSKSKEDRQKDGSKEERHKDGSKSKEDRHKDGSKEVRDKDGSKSKEDRQKDSSKSKEERHKDSSKPKEDRHKDRSKSKEEKDKDRSKPKEDRQKDSSKSKEDRHKEGSKSKQDINKEGSKSKQDINKDGSRSKEDRHKDGSRSKEDRHKDGSRSKEDRHKDSGQSKHKHQVKEETPDTHALDKENGKDTKAGVLKMTLVDLDLFKEVLTDEKRHKSKDSTKGKSRDKKASGEKPKDKHIKSDDKDTKKHEEDHSEETKGIKRELEEEEAEAEQKKWKPDPEEDEKVQEKEKSRSKTTKKRKNAADEGGETKAKRTKEAKKKEEESKWKWTRCGPRPGRRLLTALALRVKSCEPAVRHWWEEKNHEDGVKWKFLEHQGPLFAPPYEPLPDDVTFYYDGQPMKLSPAAEEVATFYGKMLDHDYTTKEIFQNNFFTDWRTQMTKDERKIIKQLEKCDFSEIHKYFFDKNEARKALPKEEKQKLKEEAGKIQEEFGFCTLDGHREKIGNFKIEPPGLFRGRGDHPKMGMLKLRIRPEDVIINCSSDSKVPPPPPGHKWKEVRFDNTVTWLASWTENIQGSIKYIMLNPSSKLKGEKDWQKYETARRLKNVVDQIRSQYRVDWKSREMKKRQRAVALYFIDKLALRAGNEKEEGETADTVGCCSLRVEHIKLFPELHGQQYVVEFDFLGKDSIRYYNKVPVEKEVFKNLKLFLENKNPEDDLFDRLNTTIVNKHLQDLMDGLTAKVFRTYNASITLQNQLKELTNEEDNIPAKILSYNRANRAVALLCNHQRAPPKTFEKSMQNLQTKIDAKEQQLKEAKKELKKAKADYKAQKSDRNKKEMEKKKKQCERLEEQLMKLKLQATDKEENKQIALGTSKLNYLDPRITVAWCKKYGVPIEKIYNKTQRDKFAWAIDMTNEDFEF